MERIQENYYLCEFCCYFSLLRHRSSQAHRDTRVFRRLIKCLWSSVLRNLLRRLWKEKSINSYCEIKSLTIKSENSRSIGTLRCNVALQTHHTCSQHHFS